MEVQINIKFSPAIHEVCFHDSDHGLVGFFYQISYLIFYEVKNIIFALLLEVIQVIKRRSMCL